MRRLKILDRFNIREQGLLDRIRRAFRNCSHRGLEVVNLRIKKQLVLLVAQNDARQVVRSYRGRRMTRSGCSLHPIDAFMMQVSLLM